MYVARGVWFTRNAWWDCYLNYSEKSLMYEIVINFNEFVFCFVHETKSEPMPITFMRYESYARYISKYYMEYLKLYIIPSPVYQKVMLMSKLYTRISSLIEVL